MNKAIRAVLIMLAVMMLAMQISFAEEPMTVEGPTISEPVPADLPDEYTEELGSVADIFSQGEIPEEPVEPTAAPTAVPIPEEKPQEPEASYEVSFVLPSGWTNTSKGTVSVQITDKNDTGLQKVEYCLNNGWNDVTANYFFSRDGKVDIQVTENGTLKVRILDPHGNTHEEETEVKVFDHTEPTFSAQIEGENLKIQASDSESGVAGVQVNGLLFTDMESGKLTIHIPAVLAKYDHLAVRAFDYAGNFSSPVSMDNPFYVVPTAAPKNTPAGTQQAPATATAVPVNPTQPPYTYPEVTSVPYTPPEVTPQIIYIQPEPTPTPVVQTEYVPIGPGMPYLADGNGHTLDVLYSAATNKQFITMQSKNGNVFYLVIDYDKPIDEEAEMYETYFLNLVDERDLMALMSEEEMPTATPQVIYVTPEPTTVPAPTPVPTAVPSDPEPVKEEKNQMTGILALVVLLVIGGGAAFYFLKVKGKNKASKGSSSYDFDEDEEDEEESAEEKTDE